MPLKNIQNNLHNFFLLKNKKKIIHIIKINFMIFLYILYAIEKSFKANKKTKKI